MVVLDDACVIEKELRWTTANEHTHSRDIVPLQTHSRDIVPYRRSESCQIHIDRLASRPPLVCTWLQARNGIFHGHFHSFDDVAGSLKSNMSTSHASLRCWVTVGK